MSNVLRIPRENTILFIKSIQLKDNYHAAFNSFLFHLFVHHNILFIMFHSKYRQNGLLKYAR